MQICMLDYLYFDGTASAWTGVKEKIEALLESQGLDELVDITDQETHGLKIDVKEGYEESNQLFHLILKNVCEKGIEDSNINNFNNQRYGALTWKTLKK